MSIWSCVLGFVLTCTICLQAYPPYPSEGFLEFPARVALDAVSGVALGPAGQIYVLHRGEPLLLSFNKDWLDGVMPEQLASHPVFDVDWQDARAYCSWNTKRLPTEAEWERAARGDFKGMDYPWGDEKPTPSMARYATPSGPSVVAKYKANDFGLHDMAGGVAEWRQDWFERTYYETSPKANPQGPLEGQYKMVRGGAWSDGPNRITVFFRNWVRPSQHSPNLGFRCVQDVEQ